MPAGDITLERFSSLADTFIRDVGALTETMEKHWREKGAVQLKEHALKIEAYIAEEMKTNEVLKKENSLL
jgi:hypothetical protein